MPLQLAVSYGGLPLIMLIGYLTLTETGVNLNTGKARGRGSGKVPTWLLKERADKIIPVVTSLRHQYLDTSLILTIRKDTCVMPVFYKGTRNDVQ